MNSELKSQLSSCISRKIDELIAEALCKRLSLDSVNVWDLANRMSKMPCGNGDVVMLDYEPIIYIELIPGDITGSLQNNHGITFGVTIRHRFFEVIK